jgi:hypothetical protein
MARDLLSVVVLKADMGKKGLSFHKGLLQAIPVTVHGVAVILIAAKNLAWSPGSNEILRCTQNDSVFLAYERLPATPTRTPF